MKKDWKHILFTVFLAVLLWAIVTLSSNFYTSVYLPVKINLEDTTLAISSISSKYVVVGVQGQGWVLSGYYWQGDRYLKIEPQSREGSQVFKLRELIKKEDLFSSETNVLNISPEVLTVNLEQKISKDVYVQPILKINYEVGYKIVSEPKTNPDIVKISGPKSKIQNIDTILTQPIVLTDIKGPTNVSAKLNLPEFITSNVNNVNVYLDVQKIVDKPINNVNINIVGMPKNVELIIFPSKLTVNVRGGIELLGKLTNKDVKAFVYYKDALKDTTGAIIPHIILPKQIELLSYSPKKIDYVIKK